MKNKPKLIVLGIMLFVSAYSGSGTFAIKTKENNLVEKTESDLKKNLISSEPFAFTENKGQMLGYDGLPHPEVKFVFQQGNMQIFLLEKGIAYQFTRQHYPEGYLQLMRDKVGHQDREKLLDLRRQTGWSVRAETFRMDMTLAGANSASEITVQGKSADYSNFYNRNVLDVHSYKKITYHNIYPGIDWVIYTNNNEVKYDFVVQPYADPSLIKMEFKHQEELFLNSDGSLTIKNVLGSITEKKPKSFQGQKEIGTKFSLNGNTVSFDLKNFDGSKELIIDPAVLWVTYYGGLGIDGANSCATDALGNVYLAGYTESTNSIASGGHQNTFSSGVGSNDAFLVKFNASGTRLWATYYGGSKMEFAWSCATDASGNVYLAGHTESTSNIAFGGHQNIFGGTTLYGDAFLVKFDGSGTRLWATYYGGLGDDYGYSCATDAFGNVYLAGSTTSTNNIAVGGHQNSYDNGNGAFLAKFDSGGTRLWATYYGGLSSGYCCATDASGNVYLTGWTASTNSVASGGHQNTFGGSLDAFLVKFDPGGTRLWATYYGGTGMDRGSYCTTDPFGNVYLTGDTDSQTNIASGGHQNAFAAGINDAFLVKFNSSGTRLWATYYGGEAIDRGLSCAIDASGNVYVCGETRSTVNIASGGLQNTHSGGASSFQDAFLVKFDASGSRLWATYFGGTGDEYGQSCATDATGNLYIAGGTNSQNNFASNGHQNTFGGDLFDGYLVKLCSGGANQPSSISGSTLVCAGNSQTYFVVNDPENANYLWALPVGWQGASTTSTISVSPLASGILSVSATNTCGAGSFQTLSISVDPCTSIIQQRNSSIGIKLYPNPNIGHFFIELENIKEAEIKVYDVTGSLITSKTIGSWRNTLDISGQAAGIYFAEITFNGISERVKLVKH